MKRTYKKEISVAVDWIKSYIKVYDLTTNKTEKEMKDILSKLEEVLGIVRYI